MSEVREQASHAAAFRVQRRKIRERFCLLQRGICFWRLRLHAQFLRLPLAPVFQISEIPVGQASGLSVLIPAWLNEPRQAGSLSYLKACSRLRMRANFQHRFILEIESGGNFRWMSARQYRNWSSPTAWLRILSSSIPLDTSRCAIPKIRSAFSCPGRARLVS